ncbi:MAG: hypothetical protein NC548_20705, partial [Lachnospiraceae bacterium]|nr:hypothetical protein [Lachnospiraceae bacterium]
MAEVRIIQNAGYRSFIREPASFCDSSAPMVSGGLVICCQRDGGGVLPCPVRTEQRSAELTANYDYGTV